MYHRYEYKTTNSISISFNYSNYYDNFDNTRNIPNNVIIPFTTSNNTVYSINLNIQRRSEYINYYTTDINNPFQIKRTYSFVNTTGNGSFLSNRTSNLNISINNLPCAVNDLTLTISYIGINETFESNTPLNGSLVSQTSYVSVQNLITPSYYLHLNNLNKLQNVNIQNVNYTYDNMFKNDSNLTNITFKYPLLNISDNTFYGTKLTSDNIKDIIENTNSNIIGNNAFSNMTSVINNLEFNKPIIESSELFANNNILNISLNTDSISNKMFYNCSNLYSGIITSKIIGENAFYNCCFETLTTKNNAPGLYIPNIVSISNNAFANNTNLKNIYLLNPMTQPSKPFTNCNPVNVSINCNVNTGKSYFQDINSIKAFTSISNLNINNINNILLNSSNVVEYLEINSANL